MNNDLLIIGILTIIALIYLYHLNEQNNIDIEIPIKENISTITKRKVRINPVPMSESKMSASGKFYETNFVPLKSSISKGMNKNKILPNTVIKDDKEKILVLLCHANWCDNCKSMKRIFDELKNEQPVSNIKFATIEEQEKNEYLKYNKNIYAYPTVLIDNNGKISYYRGDRNKQTIIDYMLKI